MTDESMAGTIQDQIQWLIRKRQPMPVTAQNKRAPVGLVVLGPYVTDQVRDMVRQGMLEADDELCPENSYWFALREVAEVKRFLGIDQVTMGRSVAADHEDTQPDLETTQPELEMSEPSDEKTPPGLDLGQLSPGQQGQRNPDATAILSIKRPAKPAAPGAASAQKKAPAGKSAIPQSATPQELASQFPRVSPMSSPNSQGPMPGTAGSGVAASGDNTPEAEAFKANQLLGLEKGRIYAILLALGLLAALIGVIWVIRSLRV